MVLFLFLIEGSVFYNLSVYLGFELLYHSLIFILILLLVTLFVLVFSLMYMNHYLFYFVFMVLIILFVVRMVLFLISERNHVLFFRWDILGIIRFLLVIFYNNWVSLSGSLETLMSNRLGDLFLIFLLVMGNWSLKSSGIRFLFNFLLVLASWTKRVQFPFHGWLVKAMEAPTPVSSLVHSRTLVTAGFVLFYRFSIEEGSFFLLMTLVSSFTRSVVASVLALTEIDIKQLVAWSTISQISLVFLFYCFSYKFYAFIHLIRHAIFKRLLFILVGLLIRRRGGDQDLRKIIVFSNHKFLVIGILICLFSLMALFFLGGIISKDLFLEYYSAGSFLFVLRLILIVEIIITFFYSYKIMKLLAAVGSLVKIGSSFSILLVVLFFGSFLFYLIRLLLQNYLVEGFYSDFSFWTWFFFLGFWLVVNIIYFLISFIDRRSLLANFFFLEILSLFYSYYNIEITTLRLNIQFLELFFLMGKIKDFFNKNLFYLLLFMLVV